MRILTFRQRMRCAILRWILLTVFTSGANAQQIEMPNVFGIGRKLSLIHTMLQELEVTKAR